MTNDPQLPPGIPMPTADGFRMLRSYLAGDHAAVVELGNTIGADAAVGEVLAVAARIGAHAMGGSATTLDAFCLDAIGVLDPHRDDAA